MEKKSEIAAYVVEKIGKDFCWKQCSSFVSARSMYIDTGLSFWFNMHLRLLCALLFITAFSKSTVSIWNIGLWGHWNMVPVECDAFVTTLKLTTKSNFWTQGLSKYSTALQHDGGVSNAATLTSLLSTHRYVGMSAQIVAVCAYSRVLSINFCSKIYGRDFIVDICFSYTRRTNDRNVKLLAFFFLFVVDNHR